MKSLDSRETSPLRRLKKTAKYTGLVLTAAAGVGLIGHSIDAEQDAKADFTSAPERAASLVSEQTPPSPEPSKHYQATLLALEAAAVNDMQTAGLERLAGAGILVLEGMGVVAALGTQKDRDSSQKTTEGNAGIVVKPTLPKKATLFDFPTQGS